MKFTFEINLICDGCRTVFTSEVMETPDVIGAARQAEAKGWKISRVLGSDAMAFCPGCVAFQKLQTALAAHECR